MRNSILLFCILFPSILAAEEFELPEDGGWYQLQSLPDYSVECFTGGPSCNPAPGVYTLVNHNVPQDSESHRRHVYIENGSQCGGKLVNFVLPEDGHWYELQSLPYFDTKCHTLSDGSCDVKPGKYLLTKFYLDDRGGSIRNFLDLDCDNINVGDNFRKGLTPFEIPENDIKLGHFGSAEFKQLLGDSVGQKSPLSYWFWENNGHAAASARNVDGKRALVSALNKNRSPSTRVVAAAKINKPAKSYRLVQRIKFSDDFSFGGKKEGGKVGFGLSGGSSRTGGSSSGNYTAIQTGFSTRIMWRENGQLYSYSYDAKSNSRSRDEPLGFYIVRGEWIDLAMEVTMNSSAGSQDGRLRIWINEDLVMDQSDYEWFGQGDPLIDGVLYHVFHGGNNSDWSPQNSTSEVYIADAFYGPGTFPY